MFDNNSAVLKLSFGQERLRLEAWGKDSIRVRAGQGHIAEDLLGALIADRPTDSAGAGSDGQTLVNGRLRAQVSLDGMVSFWRSDDGRELVSEEKAHFWWPGPRLFLAKGNGFYRIEQRFKGYEGEKLFGLGQHLHGRFDQKGLVMDSGTAQRGGLDPVHGLQQRLWIPVEPARRGSSRTCGQRHSLGGRQRTPD